MQFNFFGDSWAWVWNYFPKSQQLEENMNSRYGKKIQDHRGGEFQKTYYKYGSFSFYEVMLERLGHDVAIYNHPAQDWQSTVSSMLFRDLNGTERLQEDSGNRLPGMPAPDSIVTNDLKPGVSVVFYSNIMRNWGGIESAPEWIKFVHDKDALEDYLTKVNLESLNQIAEWAVQNKQLVLIYGGQGRFPKSLFSAWKKRNQDKPVYLRMECFFSEMYKKFFPALGNENPEWQDVTTFGDWKLSTDATTRVDETWDPKLIDMIYQQQNIFDFAIQNGLKHYAYPDSGHPNLNGCYRILDDILYAVETIN